MPLFLTCQILGLLVNTLASNEKYPVFNRDNLSLSSINIIKMVCRFQQCLATFTMLLVEGSSEMGVLRHFLTKYSESVISETQNL